MDSAQKIQPKYSLVSLIKEELSLLENLQLADKFYFKSGKLSNEAKEQILQITNGDAYTKIIADIYYYFLKENNSESKENTTLNYNNIKELKEIYNSLKSYNKNVFPIAGLNINSVSNVQNLIYSINERKAIIELLKKLPSIAIRNLKNDIRKERSSQELHKYKKDLEYFLSYYSALYNRDEKLRAVIDRKVFKSDATIEDLLQFIEDKNNLIGGAKFTKNMIRKLVEENPYDLEIVFEKGKIMIVDVTSPEGIKTIGCNSLWCFTYGKGFQEAYRQWSSYSTNDHVYVIIDFGLESDSPEFMHVLIKPIEKESENNEGEGEGINDDKLFDMSNEPIYSPLPFLNSIVGEENIPIIFNFGQEFIGPTSKYPYEDPNQLKLDLKEIRRIINYTLFS
jgi:hypothetical protein